jgi:hypothetical protein
MNSVIKGTGYVLVHVPDMIIQNGTTQTAERAAHPDSAYLKSLPEHLRTYEDALSYWPNQIYIGNAHPKELRQVPFPYFREKKEGAGRYGTFGEIMPENEFLLLAQASDVFDVVKLEKEFVAATRDAFAADPVISAEIAGRVAAGTDITDIDAYVRAGQAEPLFVDGKLVGCVKSAHDTDINLSAHVMHENIMSKASSVLALLHAVKQSGVDAGDIEYVIDCAEEACGDMNQRGGGNFAKAAAEIAGFSHASGADVRAFCAAPVHAMIMAASLVKAGTYKTVAVTAGGCTAKLGMNSKDHVKKECPVLEDCLGGFAVIIAANDGVHPEINLDLVGRHTVGTGSSPQAVITSLVAEPLERNGLKIPDIDIYSPEMQNPDITKPAGAGDVPMSNYKMIAALAVKRGDIERKDLADFVEKHGLIGWAPTQGHIPSGVPAVGFACEDIMAGLIRRVMLIGKGSLFLGRMTDLFDGVSLVIQPNSGGQEETGVSEEQVRSLIARALKEFAQSLTGETRG